MRSRVWIKLFLGILTEVGTIDGRLGVLRLRVVAFPGLKKRGLVPVDLRSGKDVRSLFSPRTPIPQPLK